MIFEKITDKIEYTKLVDVVPLTSVDSSFTYLYVAEKENELVGFRVLIPFAGRKMTGIVVKEHHGEINFPQEKLKRILDVLDTSPSLSRKMLDICYWIAEYYHSPIGDVFRAALPPKLTIKQNLYAKLLGVPKFEDFVFSKSQSKVVEFLKGKNKPTSVKFLQKQLKIQNISFIIENLAEKGIIGLTNKLEGGLAKHRLVRINREMFESEKFDEFLSIMKRRRKLAKLLNYLNDALSKGDEELHPEDLRLVMGTSSISNALKELEQMGFVSIFESDKVELTSSIITHFEPKNELTLELNLEQNNAKETILSALEQEKFASFLLFGVTGSGKTLVYMHSVKKCLEMGKSAILLVPEISITPQLIARFENSFPEQIAVLHSKLTLSERARFWHSVRSGKRKLVIGARSAIFAPVQNLGLIVVDEEHEPSYKQESPNPRYNARDVALMRGKLENAVVVLGSATPSIGTYFLTKNNRHKLLQITKRADGAQMPKIIVVDVVQQRKQSKMYGQYSAILIEKIVERARQKEGVIIFQNRRGFGLLVECKDCGYIPKCPNCEVSLTYHKFDEKLKCHYCGYSEKYEGVCKNCASTNLLVLGYGTQRLEEDLQKYLEAFDIKPKIERFDLDSVRARGMGNDILKRFYTGEIDILVGTQLIAKGLDFERVTLVGIVNADLQMNLPDFTSAERAFQLFTQVAGRAGRKQKFPGEVVIQTYNPNAYPIVCFENNDYNAFYQKEINFRKELNYPPFTRLIALEIQDKDPKKIENCFAEISGYLKSNSFYSVLGPVVPLIPKIQGRLRNVVLIKVHKDSDPSGKKLGVILKKIENNILKKHNSKDFRFIIDVDCQYSLM